jgi:hypothetical protein
MGTKKEANRAEAIAVGIGQIVLLLLLYPFVVYALPQMLKGKSTAEMLSIMEHSHVVFELLGAAVVTIGLIVWFIVRKGK